MAHSDDIIKRASTCTRSQANIPPPEYVAARVRRQGKPLGYAARVRHRCASALPTALGLDQTESLRGYDVEVEDRVDRAHLEPGVGMYARKCWM